ncbi:MAG: hypothetical protein HYX78_00605 [Armatimonadetes bacterium]|nr:hypothetical protein [Armatimonadota bacterium]
MLVTELSTVLIGNLPEAEIPSTSARVPGSVQYSLRRAGLLPDWNIGLNARACEWVENRHWIYEVDIPGDWIEPGKMHRLRCLGLDYRGRVILNGESVGSVIGSYVPHEFDITPYLCERHNVLRIVFELSPRWLGQYGYTSRITDWKPRFNYTWDWTARLVSSLVPVGSVHC